MDKYDIAVVGGGASGICAAIRAAERGNRVVILEKNKVIGRKIMVSGSGRCNLLNERLSQEYYNPAAKHLVGKIFSRFGRLEIMKLFEALGLKLYSQEGRIFPVTNQAASVVKVLEIEIKRLAVPIEFDFDVVSIMPQKDFTLTSRSGRNIFASRVIIAGGGKTYPALGTDGKLYKLIQDLGHSIIEPVPSAVPLTIKNAICHLLQGQKIPAKVRSIISNKDGAQIEGELLFTKYGLSGTAILDISDEISVAVNRNGNSAIVSIDTVPFMELEALRVWLCARIKKGVTADNILIGILPNKFSSALWDLIQKKNVEDIAGALKDMRFSVSGTRGWNEAEFTSGGVNIDEINTENLESKLHKGLHFCGEILDVNGKRGGYNLAWAWASGYIAGESAFR